MDINGGQNDEKYKSGKADHQGRSEEHKDKAAVDGVPHEAIRACLYQLMPFF